MREPWRYRGIVVLKIYGKNKFLQKLKNIEDKIDFREINFEFFDYNMDGHLNFRIPVDCGKPCYKTYFLYSAQREEFVHIKDWGYLRIDAFDFKNKRIKTKPFGNARQ